MARDDNTRRDDAAEETEGARNDASAGAGGASAGRHGEMQEIRRGIPGKGFDAGTGYGGAGGDSAYSGASSYGGQAGYGGSMTRGAYAGGKYGRPDDPDGPFAGRGLDAIPPEPPEAERRHGQPKEEPGTGQQS